MNWRLAAIACCAFQLACAHGGSRSKSKESARASHLASNGVAATTGQHVPAVRWLKTFGTPGTDIGEALVLGTAGDAFVLARSNNPGTMGMEVLRHLGDGDIWVARVSDEGTVKWAKSFGSTRSDFGADLAVDDAGDLFALVYFGADAIIQEQTLVPGWYVLKMRGATGSMIWEVPFRERVHWQPQLAVVDDRVIVSSESASASTLVFAVDALDGELIWSRPGAPSNRNVRAARWQAVAGRGRVFLGDQSLDSVHTTEVTVTAIDVAGGAELWRKKLTSVNGVRLGRLRSDGMGVCAVGEFSGSLQQDEVNETLVTEVGATKQNYIACWDQSGEPSLFRQFVGVQRTMDFLTDGEGMTIVGEENTEALLCRLAIGKVATNGCSWEIRFPLPRSLLPAYRLSSIGPELVLLGTFQGVLPLVPHRSKGFDFFLARIQPR